MATFILLTTPQGDCRVPMDITYSASGDVISVSLIYEGNEYIGNGLDAQAFADLQKGLPNDVLLKCCLSCQHGNMCPYCNSMDIYCTSDTVITSKNDVCDVFDLEINDDAFEQRKRDPVACCERFVPQCDELYVYNDYYYEIRH